MTYKITRRQMVLLVTLLLTQQGLMLFAMSRIAHYSALAARHERYFIECLRGEWRTVTPDGKEWGCPGVEMNDPKWRERRHESNSR